MCLINEQYFLFLFQIILVGTRQKSIIKSAKKLIQFVCDY